MATCLQTPAFTLRAIEELEKVCKLTLGFKVKVVLPLQSLKCAAFTLKANTVCFCFAGVCEYLQTSLCLLCKLLIITAGDLQQPLGNQPMNTRVFLRYLDPLKWGFIGSCHSEWQLPAAFTRQPVWEYKCFSLVIDGYHLDANWSLRLCDWGRTKPCNMFY